MEGSVLRLSLVVLSIFSSHTVLSESCTDGCQFNVIPIDESLNIVCTQRCDVTAALEAILTNNSHFVVLTVSGSGMKQIPTGVCGLLRLRRLILTNNSLESLDPECFRNLSQLSLVNLNMNKLNEIPDHIFDGNTLLKWVAFENNCITEIGLHVFSNVSNLQQLEHIDLSDNEMTSLEVWPLILMNVHHNISIDLRDNSIEKLTNELNWNCSCNLSGHLQLQNNQLYRFSDFQHGWKIESSCIFNLPLIEIQQNNYHCDCIEYKWIQSMQALQYFFDVIPKLICHTPHFQDRLYPLVISVPLHLLTCRTPSRCDSKCISTEIPDNNTFRVQCDNQVIIPKDIPCKPYWNFPYKFDLDLAGNQIEHLHARSYMLNVTSLDVSNNRIQDLNAQIFFWLRKADHIKLDNNRLIKLPKAVKKFDKLSGTISLHSNPWDCSCKNAWLKEWMRGLNASLLNPNAVLCGSPTWHSGNRLLTADFCAPNPNAPQLVGIGVSIGSIIGVVMITLISLVVLYKARVWIYTRFHVHMFDEWDASLDGRYDAFLSFAWNDYSEVQRMADFLEDEHGFSCCIHPRDFHPGDRFMDQMGAGIDDSRRVICFLSPDFLQSKFCIWELKYALERDVYRGKKRLLIIMLKPISFEFDRSNQVVQQYISTHTYLEIDASNFEAQLLYIMPSTPVQASPTLAENDQNMDVASGGEIGRESEVSRLIPYKQFAVEQC